jgi:hypothetical protein
MTPSRLRPVPVPFFVLSVLLSALALTLLLLAAAAAEAPAAADEPDGSPVIVAVGDIVCAGIGKGTVQPPPTSRSTRACRSDLVADLITEIDPDRFLAVGDLYYGKPTLDGFMAAYDVQFGHLKDITAPALGNHEYDVAGAEGYFAYFGAAAHPPHGYYSFRLGDWLLISLNSQICLRDGDCEPGTPQYQFLEQTLEENADAGCTLAYMHHPRYDWRPWQKWIRDDEGRTLYGGSEAEPLVPLWELLYEHRADVVVAAHNHLYQRWVPQDPYWNHDPDGIVQFTVGTGGALLYSLGIPPRPENLATTQNQAHGVLKVTLHDGSYDHEWASAAGQPEYSDEDTGIPCHEKEQ